MTIEGRVLPPREWDAALGGTPLAREIKRLTRPEHARVVVVEVDGIVEAGVVLFTSVIAAGLWHAEGVRGHAGVARALLTALTTELLEHKVSEILARTDETTPDHVERMYEHAGGHRMEGTWWVLPVQPPKEPHA